MKSHARLSISASAKPRELMAEPQVKGAWTANIITLFPEAFPGVLGLSLTGRALAEGLWNLRTIPLRQFGIGKRARQIQAGVTAPELVAGQSRGEDQQRIGSGRLAEQEGRESGVERAQPASGRPRGEQPGERGRVQSRIHAAS